MKKTASVLGLFALSLFLVCCALAEAEFPLRSDIHFGDTMEDILSKEKHSSVNPTKATFFWAQSPATKTQPVVFSLMTTTDLQA
ncbi:MAG: hypothetical protein ACLR07_17530 [Christensenellales bacterium]